MTLVLAPPAPTSGQLHVGLQSGLNLSTFSGTFVESSAWAWGGTFAADLEYWLNDEWIVDLDLGLVQRGAGNLPVGGEIVDYRLNYLEMPLTFGPALSLPGGRWQISPYAGIALAWARACGVRFEGQSHYMTCDDATPGGAAASIDWSLPFGVALRHRYPGGSRISIDVRFAPSFSRVLTPGGLSARSQLLQARFGFVLPLTEGGP